MFFAGAWFIHGNYMKRLFFSEMMVGFIIPLARHAALRADSHDSWSCCFFPSFGVISWFRETGEFRL